MSRWTLSLGVVAICLAAVFGTALASDLTPEEIATIRTVEPGIEILGINARVINHADVDTTVVRFATSGLDVVGVGEQVCVGVATGFSTYGAAVLAPTAKAWTLTGPTGSSATLTEAKTKAGETFGQMFVPDVEGQYEVGLTLTLADGDTSFTQTITAAKYVGVDRCASCHNNFPVAGMVDDWRKTGHASMLQRALEGTLNSHYGGGCVGCHSVGSNAANTAIDTVANGGFEDVAKAIGWAFPDSMPQGAWTQVASGGSTTAEEPFGKGFWNLDLSGDPWEALPDTLKALAGIQCESCHGPGSAHVASRKAADIGTSLKNGVCARCHDDGHYHVRPAEWSESAHSKVWSRGPSYAGGSCNSCHLGSGYVKLVINEETDPVLESGATQTCGTCHDPHTVAKDHQVRNTGTATVDAMVPGSAVPQDVTAEMGTSAQCAQCHNMRPGRNVLDSSIHHSHQTEMVIGVGGYHYEGVTYTSGSHKHAENVCVTCHMSKAPSNARGHLGGHSWAMTWDNDTPTDATDDVHNTTGCANCHGPLQDFNVNGAQTEITELLAILGAPVPKDDYGGVATHDNGGHGSAVAEGESTPAELQAAWNYGFVADDGTKGVHNFAYSKQLLVSALKDIKGEQPAALAGDFNSDGAVDFADVFTFASNFGKTSASAGWDAKYDLNGNGAIGFTDWLMLLDQFGSKSAATKPVAVVDNGINSNAVLTLVGSNHPSIDSDHIAITLRAESLTELQGYGAQITYDADALEFVRAVRVQDGLIQQAVGGPTLAVLANETGKVTVSDAIVGDQAASGSGDLVDLVFRRLGMVTSESVQIDFTQLSDLSFGINRPGDTMAPVGAPTYVYALGENYPNPFNPATTIQYSLAGPGDVRVEVYNALGQQVRALVDHYKLAGDYSVKWDGRDSNGREVASGVYVYRMEAQGFTATHQMVLLK